MTEPPVIATYGAARLGGKAQDTMDQPHARVTDEEALLFHSQGKPGKLEISPTKPLTTQRDLTLA